MSLQDIAARLRLVGEYHRALEIEILRYRCRKLGARIRQLRDFRDGKARRTFRMRAS